MKKENILSILCIAFAVAMASCAKQGPVAPQEEEEWGIDFDMSTRAPYPENTTFGFILYYNSSNEPARGLYETGTYRYGTNMNHAGLLIPCTTNDDGTPVSPTAYNPESGLFLREKNNALECYMYTPGFTATYNSGGSVRIKYPLTSSLQVSSQPFPVDFRTLANNPANTIGDYNGYKKVPVPASLTLKDVSADLSFDFIQASATNFTIANAMLLYRGEYGYYHPKLGLNDVEGQATSAPVTITLNAGSGPQKYVSAAATKVFPANYALSNIMSLLFRFDITYSGGTITKDIPLTITVKSSMHYNFHINVTTQMLTVTYDCRPWDPYDAGSMDVGNTGLTLLGTFPVGTWTENGSSTTVD
ncbi:MAG: hypothetical protein LBH06_03735 [Rikenellaceae bacterium]|jgi:hypothetical protein|nr:hypothetical protein [Rikenellaceae bacterium]